MKTRSLIVCDDALLETPKRVDLESFKSAEELELLNVKQLKELLTRNRVEYRGCLERAELLERATRLWRDHAKYKDGERRVSPVRLARRASRLHRSRSALQI